MRIFRFWMQESAFFVGRPFHAVKKTPDKTAWKGRPTAKTGRANNTIRVEATQDMALETAWLSGM
jgi:hypothetical protein